ncbi:RHS repeat-associated core domain-containing protein [Burkholderia stagnalis]|uniref:RHS repeat-associated core domain-containing protein n=1 Tax=Burkholderia stagnalis TaxID=1503054 RepID=UPI000F575108|nr:RHS repeat-associated core domain-containing protein [Burkholderia stagnalis]RQQ42371.1 type IV secretion protein Rhs [Burkholderia stagnalis]RQX89642.1 type IV secretion protein Rhs [Burkholderia stagnalis]RQY07984.1 type IV secretion protein Rhs [Burkholderia stagnalis]RQY23450.1 type IV secretion protein Rhs [Burkholderia stagnalis]
MGLLAVKHLDPVVGVDVHSVWVAPSPTPVFLPHPHVGFMLDLREYVEAAKGVVGSIAMAIAQEKAAEYLDDHPDVAKRLDDAAGFAAGKLADLNDDPIVAQALKLQGEATSLKRRIGDALGASVGAGGGAGRPIFVNGLLRATAGTHSFHVPGLHFPLGEAFAPPPPEDPLPSDDTESYMGSRTVLANNDPMSFMALPAMSCWSVGLEPPPHNGAHTERSYPSMPSSVMLPIPAGRPVLVGGPPVMNMAAAAKGLFKAFQGSKWARALADKLHLKSGFLRCKVLHAEPVDAITGEVIVQQHDFTVAGRLPLVWVRSYAGHAARHGAVGAAWQTPADIRLDLVRNGRAVGAVAHLPDLATAFDAIPDEDGWPARRYDWQHGHALYRQRGLLVLRTQAGIEYVFVWPAHRQHAVDPLADGAALTLPVERMADLSGNAWVFERGPDRGLVRVVELKEDAPTGRAIACDADADAVGPGEARAHLLGQLTLIDADGRAHPLVGYAHDRSGNLVAVLDAMGLPRRFAYDDDHRMVRHTSARGIAFHYSHRQHDDGVWRVEHAWGDNGLFDYHFAYDVAHRETRIVDSLQHATILQSDARGMPVARIDPLGGVTTYRYDAQGRTCAETDPAGRTTTWAYDPWGNLLAQTLPDGSAVQVAYDTQHRPVCVTAPGDRQWRYAWDDRGRLLAQSTPTHSTQRYAYDRHGQLIAHTGPRGAVTRFDYDRDGNLAAVTDALGHCARYTHDARANVIRVVDALAQASHYEYDRNGNLTRAIEPGEREALFSYDADGNLLRYRDPGGQVTRFDYSALGQVVKRLTPDGNVIEYRYDTEAQLIGVVNERGELYRLTRDALGRIVEEVDYWGQSRRHEYGAGGQLLRSIDPNGQAIAYETDALGRIVRRRVPDPRQPDGVRTETFSYDRSGNLIVAENPDGRIEREYDAAGRVVAERGGDDAEIANVYDLDGNRIARTTRLRDAATTIERTTRYAYDALDRIAAITIDDAPPIVFERDALGRIRIERFGDALRRELSYTADRLLARQTLLDDAGPRFARDYAYDANGDMIARRDTGDTGDTGGGEDRFRYDPVGRLTEHLDAAGRLRRFAGDRAGDLLATRIREGNATRDAFGSGPRIDAWCREGACGDAYHAFDRIGNLVRKQDAGHDMTLRWDGDGLLVETCVVRPARADGAQGGALQVWTRYSYDALRRRTKKVTQLMPCAGGADARAPVSTTRFFWDGDVLIGAITRRDPQFDLLLARALDGAPLADRSERPGDGAAAMAHGVAEHQEWVCYPGTSHPLAWLRATLPPDGADAPMPPPRPTIHWLSTDPNGMPIRGDAIGHGTPWRAAYASWGALDRPASTPGVEQPLRFLGQYEDRETGLFYNRHRYYDPDTARYISIDPIRLSGGDHPYRYGRNPLGWVDPLGLAGVPTRRVPRYFGHTDPLVEAQVRAKVVDFLKSHPGMVTSGRDNIAVARLNDGSLQLLHGNQTVGHPEARLLRAYPGSIELLWSELQPCDINNYYLNANKQMQIKDTPCQTVIDSSSGLKAVFYRIATGLSGPGAPTNAQRLQAFRSYAVNGDFR